MQSDHHQGIEICWRLKYTSIFDTPLETTRVYATLPGDSDTPVFFDVNLSENPEFKFAYGGEIFWLDGKIKSVEDTYILVECRRVEWEQMLT